MKITSEIHLFVDIVVQRAYAMMFSPIVTFYQASILGLVVLLSFGVFGNGEYVLDASELLVLKSFFFHYIVASPKRLRSDIGFRVLSLCGCN